MFKKSIITFRLEPTQTFLFRDVKALKAYFDISLHTVVPALDSAAVKELLDNSHQQICYFPISAAVWRANLNMLLRHPWSYVLALLNLAKLHILRPTTLFIHLALFPLIVAQADYIEREGIRHVHGYWATYSTTAAMTVARLLSISYSMSIHAHDLYEEKIALSFKARGAAVIILCSEAARDELIRRIPDLDQKKIFVCKHGLDLNLYQYCERCIKPTNQPTNIMAVGRLVPKKGFHILVRAVDRIARQGYKVRCHICGPVRGMRYYRNLKQLIASCDNHGEVMLTGWLPLEGIRRKLQYCDIYVQPSIVDTRTGDRDGIPNSLLEAIASGAPVVATNVGGIPEVIRQGETGILVQPSDEIRLANAILQVLNDPAQSRIRAQKARKLVEEQFDLTVSGHALAEAFNSVISHSGAILSDYP